MIRTIVYDTELHKLRITAAYDYVIIVIINMTVEVQNGRLLFILH